MLLRPLRASRPTGSGSIIIRMFTTRIRSGSRYSTTTCTIATHRKCGSRFTTKGGTTFIQQKSPITGVTTSFWMPSDSGEPAQHNTAVHTPAGEFRRFRVALQAGADASETVVNTKTAQLQNLRFGLGKQGKLKQYERGLRHSGSPRFCIDASD